MNTSRVVIGMLLISLCLTPQPTFLQDCTQLIDAALEATNGACGDTGRNQVCYGNLRLDFEPQTGVDNIVFNQQGDIADVAALRSLRLSPYNESAREWGVALMRIQANLPDTVPGQNVTLLLFGGVEIANAAPLRFDVTAAGSANLRASPSTQAEIVGSLSAGESISVSGRLADSSWLRVDLPDGGTGWIFAQLVNSTHDLNTLAVVDDAAPAYRPMQAFYFSSGIGDAPCAGAPESGLLIQSPQGGIELSVNEVSITLGSTVFLQAQPSDTLRVNVIEHQALVTAYGTSRLVVEGTRVQVPLDANRAASGPPGELQPYDAPIIQALPFGNLERPISIPAPLTPEEIGALPPPLSAAFSDNNADVQTCDTQVNVPDAEVDIVETRVRETADTFVIEVQLDAGLVSDYSFAVVLNLIQGGRLHAYRWQTHDGVIEIGELNTTSWELLPQEEQHAEILLNREAGVVSFVFQRETLPTFNQIRVRSFHTPSREMQPQPAHCDRAGPYDFTP